MRIQPFLLPALLLLVLTACDTPQDPPAEGSSAEEAHDGDGIAWFEGSVDEAFAYAQEQNRPLFLYWGAVWCPPCHYLKSKIFTREEFIAQTRSTVPVYLDGDTERAQIYGEQFGVQGYPTVILFNPAGQEITRMLSSLPIDHYAEVLERAMSRMRPIREIFDQVQADGPAAADPIDLNLLAFYAWGQDHELQLSAEDKLEAFRSFYRQMPTELAAERSRFLSLYLIEAIRRARTDKDALEAKERNELQATVSQLLADPELRLINLDLLLYWSQETVELLYPVSDGAAPDPERETLIAAWHDATRAVEADDSLSVDDRLSALLPRLWLTKLQLEPAADVGEAPSLPETLRQEVRDRIAWASQAVDDEGELQAVMSTMASLLEDADMTEEAEALLSERLEETVAPYYFMSWIAGMKRQRGETEEALKWYRKAYDSSTGRYSRFRWGSLYLRARITVAPEDADALKTESLEILDELLTFDDAFAGGNFTRLEQLEAALQGWNQDGSHGAVVAAIRERVQAACERYPEGGEDAQRSRCRAFLNADASA